MDGYAVVLHDTVHDVLHGAGKVVELLPTAGRFRVKFSSQPSPITYSNDGYASRYSQRTLYWRNPVLVAPFKDDKGWNKISPIISAVIAAFRAG
jgi:hypothetical protein